MHLHLTNQNFVYYRNQSTKDYVPDYLQAVLLLIIKFHKYKKYKFPVSFLEAFCIFY